MLQRVQSGTDVSPTIRTSMAHVAASIVPRSHVEDVVQDVLVGYTTSPEKFDEVRGSLRNYLVTKTRGRAIDVLRSESARRRREDRADLPCTSPSAEQVALGDGARARAMAALDLLPEIERRPIVMAFFGERTYQQVAAELGLPEGTVKGRIRSGLARLQMLVEPADLR